MSILKRLEDDVVQADAGNERVVWIRRIELTPRTQSLPGNKGRGGCDVTAERRLEMAPASDVRYCSASRYHLYVRLLWSSKYEKPNNFNLFRAERSGSSLPQP